MIDYIKGEITELTPTMAVVETSGMGFAVNISLNTYQQLQDAATAHLYIYENITEDSFRLFGFTTKEEREMFLLLISVSGVGAGTARMILSTYAGAELQQIIASEDVKAIARAKGVGPKTAQRIIVDLKDKVLKLGFQAASGAQARTERDERHEEAVAALVALGFQQAASAKVVDRIAKENPDAAISAIIKMALKML